MIEEKTSNRFINVISIAVVLVVAVLLALPNKLQLGEWTKSLPHVIGSVNSVTSLVLIVGLIAIKSGKIALHRFSMLGAALLGFVFLICYVTYHLSNPSSRFQGTGIPKAIYLFTLLTHVVLSIGVLPLVLRALYFALVGDFVKHRRIAKFAYPVWLYVAFTGVVVYFMNYHFYAN
ncbi:MAG: DUF420 domain-containing protein [Pyrinomonadaceae bacterium]